jgi:hypothetical protein
MLSFAGSYEVAGIPVHFGSCIYAGSPTANLLVGRPDKCDLHPSATQPLNTMQMQIYDVDLNCGALESVRPSHSTYFGWQFQ